MCDAKDEWIERLDEILQHTKKKLHTDFDLQLVDQLHEEGALPKQASLALVVGIIKPTSTQGA